MEHEVREEKDSTGSDGWFPTPFDAIDERWWIAFTALVVLWSCCAWCLFAAHPALADAVRLPGEDVSSQMDGAGTLLRFVDTAIFSWVARLLCGLCIGGAAWGLKEARFGSAVIAIISAILFGTAPTWVKNIFSISGSSSVFQGKLEADPHREIAWIPLDMNARGRRRG